MEEEKRPFLSWCLIVRNAEKTLDACLKSIRDRTPNAEIVIVDTCSSDRTIEIVKQYADVFEIYKGPRGDWDEKMPAFDDAAAARNRSFELAHGEWVGWIDSDDVLPGPAEAERLLRENGRWHPGKETKVKDLDVAAPLPPTLEDVIRMISAARPEISCFYAPYLYRRNADGTAAEWQERERIVKNDGSYHWVGKGHEILVPKKPAQGGANGVLAGLLFLHMKEWKGEDFAHSLSRHYNALIKEYDQGDRSSRTALYLENFAKFICPQRRSEFLQAAYENSFTPLERCRTLIRAGEYAAEQGFFMDSLESFAAAMALRPDLPDPWLSAAGVFERAQDWGRAAEWYAKGASLPVNAIESLVNPRDLLIGFPVKAAECFRKLMLERIRARDDEGAKKAAAARFQLLSAAYGSEAAGPDKETIALLLAHAENDLGALDQADALHRLWNYLVRNEETKKAADLIRLAPHTLEDYPRMLDLKAWADKIDRHLSNPKAYAAFYNSSDCGALFDHNLFAEGVLPMHRVRFLIERIQRESPRARILEVGCFDGSVGIHVLRSCPDVTYVAVDAMREALEKFEGRAEKEGFSDRLELHRGMDLDEIAGVKNHRFDVIVFFEIIEHVPDPVASLRNLKAKLRPGGRLFVSTPWGAFDRGRPYNLDTRDPRGHVRAMTARELYDAVEKAGFRVLEQNGVNVSNGATLHLMAARDDVGAENRNPPVNFFVPSALWEWNATHVVGTGIGASEETIVYLARELARDGLSKISVYGPVPTDLPNASEEVHEGVAYWTREKANRAEPGTLIVSRSPAAGRLVDPKGKQDRILWLQDTVYPDLNEDTARDYRRIVTLTEWHKWLIGEQVGTEKDRIEVIPNFLLPEHFRGEGAPERQPHHFIYASSPDRGLVRLLKIWPRIRKAFPDATLDIFYGWEGSMKLGLGTPAWTKLFRKVRTEYMALRWQPGVTERGRVNHEVLAREFQRSSAWLYPTHFCLHPDSMISVPGDHRTGLPVRVRIADLEGKEGFPVYCYDEKEQRFRIGTATKVWKTKIADRLLALHLDDGAVLKVTPEHRVMNFDGEWVKAEDLHVGDRLMALHHRYDVMIKDQNHKIVAIEELVDPIPVYDMEVEEFHTFVADGVVVHNCETGCLTAAKARAAGCVPVTTRYAGLAETGDCDLTQWVTMPNVGVIEDPTAEEAAFEDYADRFVEAVKRAVEVADAPRRKMAAEAIDKYEIGTVLPLWRKIIDG